MKTWQIISQADGNDAFEVRATSVETAAFAALSALGWAVSTDKSDPAGLQVVEIHVRGGVAYPPEDLPPGIRVLIVDHDNR